MTPEGKITYDELAQQLDKRLKKFHKDFSKLAKSNKQLREKMYDSDAPPTMGQDWPEWGLKKGDTLPKELIDRMYTAQTTWTADKLLSEWLRLVLGWYDSMLDTEGAHLVTSKALQQPIDLVVDSLLKKCVADVCDVTGQMPSKEMFETCFGKTLAALGEFKAFQIRIAKAEMKGR